MQSAHKRMFDHLHIHTLCSKGLSNGNPNPEVNIFNIISSRAIWGGRTISLKMKRMKWCNIIAPFQKA